MQVLSTVSRLTSLVVASAFFMTACGTSMPSEKSMYPVNSAAESTEEAVDSEPSGASAAQEEVASASEELPSEPSPTPVKTPPQQPILQTFTFTTTQYDANVRLTYDHQQRVTHIEVGMDPEDFSDALDLLVTYDEAGQASVAIDPADTAGREDTPDMPLIKKVELQPDGTLALVEAGFNAEIVLEFNDDGLPDYICYAQEDLGYQLTYDKTADGTWELQQAVYVADHLSHHTDTPVSNGVEPKGTFTYTEA